MYAFRSRDPRALARFWAGVMELPISDASTDQLVMLDLDHEFSPVTWLFEYDDSVSAETPRVSLNITTDDPDGWRGIADRAERLGAVRKSDNEQGGVRWVEMEDPDGNPFRVLAPRQG
jgi:catechol 2,3-dioxygenase-like lactoylglutathione lyase family enzyme